MRTFDTTREICVRLQYYLRKLRHKSIGPDPATARGRVKPCQSKLLLHDILLGALTQAVSMVGACSDCQWQCRIVVRLTLYGVKCALPSPGRGLQKNDSRTCGVADRAETVEGNIEISLE